MLKNVSTKGGITLKARFLPFCWDRKLLNAKFITDTRLDESRQLDECSIKLAEMESMFSSRKNCKEFLPFSGYVKIKETTWAIEHIVLNCNL